MVLVIKNSIINSILYELIGLQIIYIRNPIIYAIIANVWIIKFVH